MMENVIETAASGGEQSSKASTQNDRHADEADTQKFVLQCLLIINDRTSRYAREISLLDLKRRHKRIVLLTASNPE
jgi:hypothetical protein